VPSTKKRITNREDLVTCKRLHARLEASPFLWGWQDVLLFLTRSFPGHPPIYREHLDVHLRSLLTYPPLAVKAGSGPVRNEGGRQADTSGDQSHFADSETQPNLPLIRPVRRCRVVHSLQGWFRSVGLQRQNAWSQGR